MDDCKGCKDICFFVLLFVLVPPLINAGFKDGPAAVLLLLFLYFAGAWLLDTIIKGAKDRKPRKIHPPVAALTQAKVRPAVPDITRVGNEAEQRINETSDAYLKTVQTMTRR
jgi:hypothetical protein